MESKIEKLWTKFLRKITVFFGRGLQNMVNFGHFQLSLTMVHRSSKGLSVEKLLFSLPRVSACVLGAEKNRQIKTVLWTTHNMCLG